MGNLLIYSAPEESLISNLHVSPQILAGIQEKILLFAHCGSVWQSFFRRIARGRGRLSSSQLRHEHAACADQIARFNFLPLRVQVRCDEGERSTSAPSRALAPARTPTKRRKSVVPGCAVAIQR
jgi:hypothetical protein